MKIDLYRKFRKNGYTIGKLSVNGVYICDTLEDTDRGLTKQMTPKQIAEIKIKGATAIPVGEYKVTITYSPRFCKKMPILNDVPGYEGVRIHSGNTAADTEGCILCGRNTEVGKVTSSRRWTEEVYTYISRGLLSDKDVTINIHW